MPAVYEQSGLRFEYPENWSVDTEESDEAQSEVIVTSPTGAFWSLSLHDAETDLDSLLDAALQGMKAEYPDLDAERVEDSIDSQQLDGIDASFFCLDLTNTAQIRGFQDDRATYLLLYQAEDRDFSKLEPVFRAVTTSMLRGLLA